MNAKHKKTFLAFLHKLSRCARAPMLCGGPHAAFESPRRHFEKFDFFKVFQ